MLVCDRTDDDRYAKPRPCLLVEVISPSTAAMDRVGKYSVYAALPSLQTYLIVEQSERRVYACGREGEQWILIDLQGEGHIDLPCLGHRLGLDEIYDGEL